MIRKFLTWIGKWFSKSTPQSEQTRIDYSEFAELFDLIERTNDNYFVTGVAGTGKSTFLSYLVGRTRKRHVVLAPTGLAALNIKGQTIHSFFNFKSGLLHPEDLPFSPLRAHLFASIQLLIIDEVSMVRADVMNAVDLALRQHRQCSAPFGGCQVLLIGDLHQLPPVVENALERYFEETYGGPYFFGAPGINEAELMLYQLQRVFRQSEADFVEILGRVREGNPTSADLIRLNARHVSIAGPPPAGALVLSATNAAAAAVNDRQLSRLPAAEFVFEAVMSGSVEAIYQKLLIRQKGNAQQLEQKLEQAFPAPVHLKVKSGAKVIFVKNDLQKRWVNGTVGVVADVSQDRLTVEIGKETFDLSRESWPRIEYEMKEGVPVAKETGMFSQFPIRLGWAITIHKSQGKSLDTAVVDLARGAFAPGQSYVALSRCRSFGGLYLQQELKARDVITDQRVRDYLKKFHCRDADGDQR